MDDKLQYTDEEYEFLLSREQKFKVIDYDYHQVFVR